MGAESFRHCFSGRGDGPQRAGTRANRESPSDGSYDSGAAGSKGEAYGRGGGKNREAAGGIVAGSAVFGTDRFRIGAGPAVFGTDRFRGIAGPVRQRFPAVFGSGHFHCIAGPARQCIGAGSVDLCPGCFRGIASGGSGTGLYTAFGQGGADPEPLRAAYKHRGTLGQGVHLRTEKQCKPAGWNECIQNPLHHGGTAGKPLRYLRKTRCQQHRYVQHPEPERIHADRRTEIFGKYF